MDSKNLNTFYVSLALGLNGYYVLFKAENKETIENYCKETFGRLWCNIYSEAYFWEIIRKRYPRNSRVVNKDRPILLPSEENAWN